MRLIAPIARAAKKYFKKPQYRARFIFSKYYDTISIDNTAVLVESFNGDDVTGAPFYVLKELCDNPRYNNLKKYVVAHKGSFDAIRSLIDAQIEQHEQVEIVLRHSREYCRLLASAKYLVTNVTFPTYFIKKPEQIYLQTWHGTPLKALGRSMRDKPNTIGNVQRNFLMSDYLVCPSEFVCNCLKDDYMIDIFYEGKYIFEGYPQNSMLLSESVHTKMRSVLGLDDKKIVIYMPTWRGVQPGEPKNKHFTYLNHALCELDDRLDDDTVVLAKPHHLAKGQIDWNGFKRVLPFPEGFETYQVLAAADILLTDYSSVMFDYLNARKPILLYTYDEESYQAGRSMYAKIDRLPFWHTDSTEALCEHINSIPRGTRVDYGQLRERLCAFDEVDASANLCKLLVYGDDSALSVRAGAEYHNDKKNVLIYAGALLKNGITASLNGLLNTVDTSAVNYTLLFYQKATAKHVDTINQLSQSVRYIPIQGPQEMTVANGVARYLYFRMNNASAPVEKSLEKLFAREVKRLFPGLRFDAVVHFTGYERQIIHILNACENAKKYIYVHNDMMQEYKLRHNYHLRSNRMAYGSYDKIAVVRDSLKPTIVDDFSVDPDKVAVVHNCNDINAIRRGAEQQLQYDEGTIATWSQEDLEELLNSDKGSIFINVARFSQEKGQQRLLEAFNSYRKDYEPDSHLIIVGGHGPEYDSLADYAEHQCDGHAILIQSLSNPHPLIKRADAMVFSSYYEGLPMAIMEALILGTPVISTNIPGPSEFLSQGYGLLVDNSTEGILEGFIKYKNGEIDRLAKFDAGRFNEKAVEEFEAMLGL